MDLQALVNKCQRLFKSCILEEHIQVANKYKQLTVNKIDTLNVPIEEKKKAFNTIADAWYILIKTYL